MQKSPPRRSAGGRLQPTRWCRRLTVSLLALSLLLVLAMCLNQSGRPASTVGSRRLKEMRRSIKLERLGSGGGGGAGGQKQGIALVVYSGEGGGGGNAAEDGNEEEAAASSSGSVVGEMEAGSSSSTAEKAAEAGLEAVEAVPEEEAEQHEQLEEEQLEEEQQAEEQQEARGSSKARRQRKVSAGTRSEGKADAGDVSSESGKDGSKSSSGSSSSSGSQDWSSLPPSPFELALRGCSDLGCLKRAHKKAKHPGQFNFPHFYILGFPKCATTSLFHHLLQHPQVAEPRIKEPNFFTSRCNDDAMSCTLHEQQKYVNNTLHLELALEARLRKVVFEGSTHYSLAGEWLAPQLRQLMPWVKLVLSMRDPISRAISNLQHNLNHGRKPSCYDPESVYDCIREYLEDGGRRYAPRLRAWIHNFPREQLHVMQYENLTGPGMGDCLHDVKRFIGIDQALPSDDLGLRNSKRGAREEGWPIPRRSYKHLVELAREDAEEVVELVKEHGFADAQRWQDNWEQAWQSNLERCKPDGLCWVQLT